jgi:hypothetical protein
MAALYSMVVLMIDRYASLCVSLGAVFRFLLRNPSLEAALLTMVKGCEIFYRLFTPWRMLLFKE